MTDMDGFALFNQYLEVKQDNHGCITFPRKALEAKEFHDLMAWDIEADGLCGQSTMDDVGVAVCLRQLGHEGDHFRVISLEPPGLTD